MWWDRLQVLQQEHMTKLIFNSTNNMNNNGSKDKDFNNINNRGTFFHHHHHPCHSNLSKTFQKSVPVPAESHTRQLSNSKLDKFVGKTSAVQWWMKFMAFISLQNLSEQTSILHLPFFSIEAAGTGFNSLVPQKAYT